LLEHVRAAGLKVQLEIVGEQPELPPALELSAYRIVQEALTNTLRHSAAEHATVTLRFNPNAVSVDVLDDGSAPPSTGGGNGRGLIGMRERVTTFGGHLEAGPDNGGGFRVSARLPVALR
jgi:signal transduction histidine kinase